MHKLFWRVFAWYLGATLSILVVGIGILRLTGADPRRNTARANSEETVRMQGDAAVEAWRGGGQAALQSQFKNAMRPRFLVDEAGHELSGRSLPPHLDGLIARARHSDDLQYATVGSEPYIAGSVFSGGVHYVYLREIPKQQLFPLIGYPLPLWARLGLGVFTALVMCSLFAFYVVSPIGRLRAATREFASGNLGARVGQARPFHRRDEFADLASDFDNMATQIQNLVLAQQRILGDISHELRSPLTRLQIALHLARRKAGAGAEENLSRIEQEAERMNLLIGQMLQSARMQQTAPGKRRLFDLALLVREVAADADFEAAASDRRVVVPLAELSVVHADRELIRSAIENVVRNAIRYTAPKTAVSIDLRRNSGSAFVTVCDHGPGVPEDAVGKLFEPFYRVNDARDRDSGGVGLGLSITRQVVTSHSGAVRARNRIGGGLEVTVEIPLKTPEMTHAGIRFRA